MDFIWLVGYTYGHAIDTAGDNAACAGGAAEQPELNAGMGHGTSIFVIASRLAATYVIPPVKTKCKCSKGWQFSTVAMLEGGEPINVGDF